VRVQTHGVSIVPPVTLSQAQVRLLGCLLEKERTTPDDYPLTANGLMRAANQTTSRDPVVDYDLHLVERTLADLKQLGLVRFVHSPSNRATKYRHVLDEAWSVDADDLAVLCLLMLRGPQTVGELKSRSERLASFADLRAVEAVLARLAARDEPMVALGQRAPGQKEARWRQLVGEAAEPQPATAAVGTASHAAPPEPASSSTGQRLAALEAQVARLTAMVAELRSELGVDTEAPAGSSAAPASDL
jgi:uncharacterized protein YceH (UPF0502 family)